MKYGLRDYELQGICNVFAETQQVRQAIIYGSRARGTNRSSSDIDIAVMGEDLNLATMARLEEKLDDLLLPYFIDLHALSSIQNEALLYNIQTEGKTIYKA